MEKRIRKQKKKHTKKEASRTYWNTKCIIEDKKNLKERKEPLKEKNIYFLSAAFQESMRSRLLFSLVFL